MTDDNRETTRRSEDQVLLQDFNELADTVLGSRVSDLGGGGRRNDGLVHGMMRMETSMVEVQRDVKTILKNNNSNGGLDRRERVLLWVAGIGGSATVLAAVIVTWRQIF